MPASNSELVTGPENIDQLVFLAKRYAEDVAIGWGYCMPDIMRAGVVGDGNRLILGEMAACLEEVEYSKLPPTPLNEITEETRHQDIRMLRVFATLYWPSEGSKSVGVTGEIRLTNRGHVGSDFSPDLSSGCELSPETLHPNQLTGVCTRMANAILVDEILADAAERAGIRGRTLSGDPYKLLMAWSRCVQLGADVSAIGMPAPPRGLPQRASIEPMVIVA